MKGRVYLDEPPSLGSVIYYEGKVPYLVIGSTGRDKFWGFYVGPEGEVIELVGEYPWVWFTPSPG